MKTRREMNRRFLRYFWLPPRAHGDVIEDRTVSFLELFYDLVFVVLIARAAHTLAHHVSWQGFGEFAAVFGLIWIAWYNGTMYHELHGRNDGRSRTFIFVQMTILALLAIYTGDAAGTDGAAFAATYTVLLLVLTWLWYTVRRQDDEAYMSITARYLTGMAVTAGVMAATVVMPAEARMIVWAIVVVGWIVGGYLIVGTLRRDEALDLTVTDSMVERFGLFTIIVLGETVVGVVDGLSQIDRDPKTVLTGILALTIGFGFWWSYFDFAGRRLPSLAGAGSWTFGHLAMTMAIAASGAAMVSLVEHADEARAYAPAAWLLGGSVALMLVALSLIMRSLADWDRLSDVYGALVVAAPAAAAIAVAIAWTRPAPWLLALALSVLLSALWFFALDRYLRSDEATPIGENV